MKHKLLLVAVFLLGATTALALTHLLYVPSFDIRGKVDVPSTQPTNIITVELNITEPKGHVAYRGIAKLEAPNETCILFKPEVVKVSETPDLRISLSGRILLVRDDGKTYTIPMPCLLTVNNACYRVAAVIPGYDEPLRIEPGTYNVSLYLEWEARGQGFFELMIKGASGTCTR